MRTVLVGLSFAIVAALTAPAFAQMGGHGMSRSIDARANEPSNVKKKPADDKDYKAALGRMPDGKYDPWRTVRGQQPGAAANAVSSSAR